jgi:uncharacterized membrane protein (UPF0127 family)
MVLLNATTGEPIARKVRLAAHWRERLIGFLNRKYIHPDEGLWFPDCAVIHTVGMQAPLDIVFVDAENRVLRTLRNVARNRLFVACRQASATIELGSGALDGCDVLVGDLITLE